MKRVMKDIVVSLLAVAAVIAAQMGLSCLAGFHTAELLGKTAMTALFLYAVMRMTQACRTKREMEI